MRMRQATVITPWAAETTTTPGALLSDTFHRADGPLGANDGGTFGPQQWQSGSGGTYGWAVRDDAAVTTQTDPGVIYAEASLNVQNIGGTTQATLARVGAGAAGIHARSQAVGFFLFLVACPGLGYWTGRLSSGGTPVYVGPHPAVGDVLTIADTLTTVTSSVNGVVVDVETAATSTIGNPSATQGHYYAGILSDTHVVSGMGLRSWSYTPPGGNTVTSPAADAVVDFGDGVHVLCARHANCSPLAVGDQVRVDRQGHSNLIVDKIIPLGA